MSKLRNNILTDTEETLFFCVELPDKPPTIVPALPTNTPPTIAPPIVLVVDFLEIVLPSSINSTPITSEKLTTCFVFELPKPTSSHSEALTNNSTASFFCLYW